MRKKMKDKILSALVFRSLDISEADLLELISETNKDSEVGKKDTETIATRVRKNTIYHLCGYLLFTRKHLFKNCQACKESLQTSKDLLKDDFYEEAELTNLKSKGGLKYCTKEMFELFNAVELVYRSEVNIGNLHVRDWYDKVMDSLSGTVVPAICCDEHRNELLPTLILEFFTVRCHFETKNWKNATKHSSKVHALHKLSKVI
jgi:hypothetical protein